MSESTIRIGLVLPDVMGTYGDGGNSVVLRQRFPRGAQWWRLAVVAAGVIAGFPILTSFALQSVPAAHGAAKSTISRTTSACEQASISRRC